MQAKNVLQIFKEVKKNSKPLTSLSPSKTLIKKSARPNSISVTDVFFGDSGKGSVIAKLNSILLERSKNKKGVLYSLRFNGGANAGHETMFNGRKIVTHQLPVALIEPAAVGVITRGVLLHPEDLLVELTILKNTLGGKLPGKLIIDERTILGLDTHRAFEFALNQQTTGGRGSTGRGIAPGYASLYLRIPVTVKDLLDKNWKSIFSQHYKLYEKMILGLLDEMTLGDVEVAIMQETGLVKRKVGNEQLFLDRLAETRSFIQRYTTDSMYELLKDIWHNQLTVPVTIEGAQAAGIDPYHGVFPDVTASRPLTRAIRDATYNIISLEDIALTSAAMKTTYFSSVGKRVLPQDKMGESMTWIQTDFDERGRSTGRLRDIYPISIPLANYFKQADGYEYLMATHLDAAKKDKKIAVVTHYVDKKTGKETEFQPYQDFVDKLEPKIVYFKGWDGEAIKKAKSVKDLPLEAQKFLLFLSKTIGPIAMGTTGPDIEEYISFHTMLK